MSLGFQLRSAARRAWGASAGARGQRRRSPGAALRLLLRVLVCQVLPAGWLLLSAASAAALPSAPAASEPAPMCDPDAASVVAQDEIPELDRGRFEALPCEAQLLLSGWQPDAPELGRRHARCGDAEQPQPAPHADTPRPRAEGAGLASVPLPARSAPVLGELSRGEGLGASRGHARVPFRPPVARG